MRRYRVKMPLGRLQVPLLARLQAAGHRSFRRQVTNGRHARLRIKRTRAAAADVATPRGANERQQASGELRLCRSDLGGRSRGSSFSCGQKTRPRETLFSPPSLQEHWRRAHIRSSGVLMTFAHQIRGRHFAHRGGTVRTNGSMTRGSSSRFGAIGTTPETREVPPPRPLSCSAASSDSVPTKAWPDVPFALPASRRTLAARACLGIPPPPPQPCSSRRPPRAPLHRPPCARARDSPSPYHTHTCRVLPRIHP